MITTIILPTRAFHSKWNKPFIALILLLLAVSCATEDRETIRENDSSPPVYTAQSLRNILFPLGGIGTGDLIIGGRGEIRALEIYGRANILDENPYMTFFALWYTEGKTPGAPGETGSGPVVRILERRLLNDFPSPWGVNRNQLSGIPRFDEAEFTGTYPFAELQFTDREIPLQVEMSAFNPLIPLDIDNSGLPAAIFHWKLTNTTDREVNISLLFCMAHPFTRTGEHGRETPRGNITEAMEIGDFRGIRFSSAVTDRNSPQYGDFTVISLPGTKIQTHGYRGRWWDNAHRLWDDFMDDGELKEISEKAVNPGTRQDAAACWIKKTLEPGEKLVVPYIMAWYVPVRVSEDHMAFDNPEARNQIITNYYATRFGSSDEVADYILEHRQSLGEKTRAYRDALVQSTYPGYVIDAVSANVAGLKTNLVLMDEQGRVHGFEGLGDVRGCCAGNCTHVWNYAQTMAFLFPEMERRVRTLSFTHDTHENGYQCFRTTFPPGDYWFKAVAADGQMGNIMRLYREWKLCGDNQWLARLWPKVKAAMEFAWKGTGTINPGHEWQKNALIPWDPNKEGVMRGNQHNTYDINFYGPNMMTGSLYLGALKACSEMATEMGEPEKAGEYRELYEKGRRWYESNLWNGEYFIQIPEVVEGISIPERLRSLPDGNGTVLPKYQYGQGCLSDQLLGQFLAHASGMGYILDPEKVDRAMESVYRYNFKPSLRNFQNVQRVYGLNDEGGLIACTWPHGNRPDFPFVYADEIWTGIEHQVAASLIWSGHVEEGLEMVRATRERYRGYNRNPWSEIESGRFYARAMSSWAILPALSGFRYDGTDKVMEFDPGINREDFRTFWSCGTGWGTMHINATGLQLKILHGELVLGKLRVPLHYGYRSVSESVPAEPAISRKDEYTVLVFDPVLELAEGQEINLEFNP